MKDRWYEPRTPAYISQAEYFTNANTVITGYTFNGCAILVPVFIAPKYGTEPSQIRLQKQILFDFLSQQLIDVYGNDQYPPLDPKFIYQERSRVHSNIIREPGDEKFDSVTNSVDS